MELPKQANLNDLWRNLSQEANLNELWRALGRGTQPSADREWLGRLSLFGAGLMVGAGLALLLSVGGEDTAEEASGASAEDLH